MEALGSFLLIICILSFVALIGLFITYLIGKFGKRTKAKRIGKIGSIVSVILTVVCFLGAAFAQSSYEDQANERFRTAGDDFTKRYITVCERAQDISNSEHKYWGNAIEDSSLNFDVDKAISGAVDKNSASLGFEKSNLKKMEQDLETMKSNDTGDYKVSGFKKCYDTAYDWVNYLSSPYGSYNSFVTKVGNYGSQAM